MWLAVKSFFSGLSLFQYLLGGVALTAAVGLGIYIWGLKNDVSRLQEQRDSLVKATGKLEQQSKTKSDLIDGLNLSLNAANDLLAVERRAHEKTVEVMMDRSRELVKVSEEFNAFKLDYADLENTDETVREWGCHPVPEPVVGLLRRQGFTIATGPDHQGSPCKSGQPLPVKKPDGGLPGTDAKGDVDL